MTQHLPLCSWIMHGKPPSSTAVGRAARLAGAAVQEIRELAGGTHAYTYLIRTAGPEQEFILREFPPGDDAARDEVRVLTALDGFDGLAPRLLAKGGGGNPSEGSWLLISRLPGAADIIPGQPATWAAQLGEALARVHATPMHRLTGFVSVFHRSRSSLAPVSGPAASVVAANRSFLPAPLLCLRTSTTGLATPYGTAAVLLASWTGPVVALALGALMLVGAGWTSVCSTAKISPTSSWALTKRRASRRRPIFSCGTFGLLLDHINMSSPGCQTTANWAGRSDRWRTS